MNKTNYKIFDLFIFTLIASAVEGINVYAFNMFKINVNGYSFSQIYSLSFSCLLGMIAIFRWNAAGLVVAPVSGAVSVAVRLFLGQSVTVNLWLAYTLGYLGLAICLLFFVKVKKEDMLKEKGLMIMYYFSGYIVVELLKSLCQIGVADYWKLLVNYIAFDLFNIVIGLLVFWVAIKQKSLVVDMNSYLDEIHTIKGKLGGQDIVSKNININVEELAEADEINEAAILDGGTLSNEDLRRMEANRRKFENRVSKFDEENQELREYQKSKEAKKHGSR